MKTTETRRIYDEARAIDILDICYRLGVTDHKDSGRYYLIKCPIHNGKDFSSFKIFKDSNRFECYGCGCKGSTIDLVAEVLGLSPKNAALWVLGEVEGLVVNTPIKKATHTPVATRVKGSPELLDASYRALLSCCDSMTSEQVNSLCERQIPREWWDRKFFNYPNKKSIYKIMDRFRPLAEKMGLTHEHLSFVPGFFIREGSICFAPMNGLGITQYDEQGRISGLQVRALGEFEGSKFRFASSSFSENGVSSGIVPNLITSSTQRAFAITEGHFKGLFLANRFLYRTLALNGVTAFKPLLTPEIFGDTEECIIFFDSDWKTNPNVRKSLESLVLEIQMKGYFKEIYVALWDESFGKGVDDVIANGHIQQITRITASEFFQMQ